MKTTKAFIAIGMMALLAASCSSESTSLEPNNLGGDVIQFATTTKPVINSRALDDADNLQDAKFNVDAPINIYLTKTGTTDPLAPHASQGQAVAASPYYKFTASATAYTGANSTANSQILVAPNNYIFQYPGTDGVNVYALHPATDTKNVDKNTATFSVEADQTTDDAYRNSDLISAIATNKTKADGTVLLNFDHKLSKVVVKLKVDDNENLGLVLDGATVKVNAMSTVSLDHSDATSASAVGLKLTDNSAADYKTITLGTYDAEKGTAGIIVPQTVEADQKLFEITLANGATFSYAPTASDDKDFESGKVYIYTLTLKAELLTLVSVEIKDWVKVERQGDAVLD